MNLVDYLKFNGEKIYLSNGGNGVQYQADRLELRFAPSKEMSINKIKEIFSSSESVLIYSAILQEDGRETDEIVQQTYGNYTKIAGIEYDVDMDEFTVILIERKESDERLSELEDAVNFILMGGDE